MNLRKASARGIVSAPVFAGLAAGLVAGLVAGLAGCTSESAREREQPAEARRKVADEDQEVQAKDVQAKEEQAKEVQAKDVPANEVQAQESSGEADRALMLREQEKLDATEQKRTNNVYAHSCRKVTLASYALKASNVGRAQCTPERLKLEQDAERQQNRMKLGKQP
jgi:hypothetical protein